MADGVDMFRTGVATLYSKMVGRSKKGDRQWLDASGQRPGQLACSGETLCSERIS